MLSWCSLRDWCQVCHLIHRVTHTHKHTHPFNGPLSVTTRVGRYQKGKTKLDFTEARDSEWQWHPLAICKSAPRSGQITMPAPHRSVFYRPDALPAAQPTASKHWRPRLHRVTHTHKHTHPFNGPLSVTTRVGRYQKAKTKLDFTEARDSEWQWHPLAICKSAPRSGQITMPVPHRSVFYRPDALPAAQPTASKHWRPRLHRVTVM